MISEKWEKGQSIHHKDDRGRFQIENTYGRLQYIKESSYGDKRKEGFLIEAKEAPGTPGHTEKEKHIDLEALKKVRLKGERFLYSSEKPFQNQAVFYDITEKERSREFMACMKRMLSEYGHRTLKDTFGFMEQDPERLEKKALEQERLRELTLEEFDLVNKQIDRLNDRIQKKEAKERQLKDELQLMIDRGKEEQKDAKVRQDLSARHFMPKEAVKEKAEDSEDDDLDDAFDDGNPIKSSDNKIQNNSENQPHR